MDANPRPDRRRRLALLALAGIFSIIWAATAPLDFEGNYYSTPRVLLRDLALSSLIFVLALTVVFTLHTGTRTPARPIWRRVQALLAATSIGALLVLGVGLQAYAREHVMIYREPPPPPWLDWTWRSIRAGGTVSAGLTTALLLLDFWVAGISRRARIVALAVIIVGGLITVDQAVNPDCPGGGTYERCVECGASRGTRHGIFHGFFAYHNGEESGVWTHGWKGFRCDHQWDGEVIRKSY